MPAANVAVVKALPFEGSMMQDPFELFGLPPTYELDQQQLNERYIALQKQFHPDNFVNRTDKEKLLATKISADIVQAHKILSDPVKRASALLNVKGMDFDLEEYISRDKAMLMEQLQQREQLENTPSKDLPALQADFEDAFSQLEHSLVLSIDADDLAQSAQIVLQMRYHQKLKETVVHKMQ